MMTLEENAEAGPSVPSTRTTVNRPGARQRRAAAAATAVRETGDGRSTAVLADWTETEVNEAMKLVSEILGAGLSPVDLVRQGVRRDIVEVCCSRLGVAFDDDDDEEEAIAEVQNVESQKSKRKRRKGSAKAARMATSSESSDAVVLHDPEVVQAERDEEGMAEMLRQKVELERERAILIRMQREQEQQNQAEKETEEASAETTSTAATPVDVPGQTSDVQAMRLAALSSMKRKRKTDVASLRPDVADDVSGHELPSLQVARGPPTDAPRAPKSRYRDIDAPQLDMARREQEAAEAFLMADELSYDASPISASQTASDMAQRRSRPVSYIDEEFNHINASAPIGYVDYAAPLPSLQQKLQERRQKEEESRRTRDEEHMSSSIDTSFKAQKRSMNRASPAIRNTSIRAEVQRRPTPFLVDHSSSLVIEYDSPDDDASHEDEGPDDDADQLIALKRIRDTHAQAMSQFWSRERTSRRHRDGSGYSTPKDVELTRVLLETKEREIVALKERMRQMIEQRARRQQEAEEERSASEEPAEKTEIVVSDRHMMNFPTHTEELPSSGVREADFHSSARK